MRRRDFLALAGATAATWPLTARAQQNKVPRVVIASGAVDPSNMTLAGDLQWSAFLQEMASHGFVEGKTVSYDRYLATGLNGEDVAKAVVASAPDAVFWAGAAVAELTAAALSKTIPMVAVGGDLISQGMVTNLAHPGGNVTGLQLVASPDFEAKNLGLLAETVPTARRVAYINLGMAGEFTGPSIPYAAVMRDAAPKLNLSLAPVVLELPGGDAELTTAFRAALDANVEMVQLGLTTPINVGSATLARLALAARMPTISPFLAFARAGGLLSYGANAVEVYRQTADYIALILRGAKAGDLPVVQPTVFDLVINLKTAKSIGVTIPAPLLVQATDVIE